MFRHWQCGFFILNDELSIPQVYISEPSIVSEVGLTGFWTSSFIDNPSHIGDFALFSEIGKTVFLTREDAEMALGAFNGN